MSPVEIFFSSVREAFSRPAGPEVWGGLLLAIALAVLGGFVASWRTRKKTEQAAAQAVRDLARRRNLSEDDLSELAGLAGGAGVPPFVLMTSLAVFERTTAQVLAVHAVERKPAPSGPAARIARLRTALGFDVLPAHHWLLTTRELRPGDEVRVVGSSDVGRVCEANEACFGVELERPAPRVENAPELTLEILRANDAHYVLHCNVMAWEDAGEGRRHVLVAHDENPERVQLREHVRVNVHRPVSLTLLDVDPPSVRKPLAGTIIDVSVGGLSVDSPAPAPRGSHLLCSFELADRAAFKNIAAKVVATAPTAHGRGHHLRLAFTGLAEPQQDRLTAALAWHEQKAAARAAG